MLITSKQAASLLGVSMQVVNRLAQVGTLTDRSAAAGTGRRHEYEFEDADVVALKVTRNAEALAKAQQQASDAQAKAERAEKRATERQAKAQPNLLDGAVLEELRRSLRDVVARLDTLQTVVDAIAAAAIQV